VGAASYGTNGSRKGRREAQTPIIPDKSPHTADGGASVRHWGRGPLWEKTVQGAGSGRLLCTGGRCHKFEVMGTGRKMDVLGELCDLVSHREDLQGFLEGLAGLAASGLTRVAGSRVECSVVLQRGKLPRAMAGSTDPVMFLDCVEQQLEEGPCLHALRTGLPVLLEDAADSRWPRYVRELETQGFTAVLGIPLELGPGATATLSFIATEPGVLGDPIAREAMAFAEEGRRALALALRVADAELASANLAAALEHRTAIDLARGILMAQSRCTAEEAFEVLRQASSNRNQKLHALALEMATRFDPAPGPAHFEP
jgi:hypothetical protein